MSGSVDTSIVKEAKYDYNNGDGGSWGTLVAFGKNS